MIFQRKISKFTLYVGLNDKDTKEQKFAVDKAKELISQYLAKNGIERSNYSKCTRHIYLYEY